MPYPIVNPIIAPEAQSELARDLFAHKDDPEAWVFTPLTDWKSDEAVAIRQEVRAIDPTMWVQFRGWALNGQQGTLMHLTPAPDDY